MLQFVRLFFIFISTALFALDEANQAPIIYSKEELSTLQFLPKDISDIIISGKFRIKSSARKEDFNENYLDFDSKKWWLLNLKQKEKLIVAPFSIEIQKEKNEVKLFSGVIARAEEKNQQKEAVVFTAPDPVKSMRWTSIRMQNELEDLVWLFSPILKRTRQMVGLSRLDPMTLSSFSLDDLFTFSGDSHSYNFAKDKTEELLLPGENNIWSIRKAVLYNLISKSSFSRFSKEILYCDLSGVPILKISFLPSGSVGAFTYTIYKSTQPIKTVRYAPNLLETTVVSYNAVITKEPQQGIFDPFAAPDLEKIQSLIQ